VNNAIAATLEARKAGHGRGGVFGRTQGSGKSFSMVFFAQKILRKVPGNWTFVVVTDRVELDEQIAKTFKACGAVTQAEGDIRWPAPSPAARVLPCLLLNPTAPVDPDPFPSWSRAPACA